MIAATEVACWAYRPEQWRLRYGLGKQPGNERRKRMQAGERHHRANARVERAAGGLRASGNWLVAVALLLLVLLAAALWR